METWIWVVLIIGVLLLLVGLGVGLYFAFRKKPKKTPTKGTKGGPTPNKTSACKSTGQPGTLEGEFSLISAGSTHTALTISESKKGRLPRAILSADPSKIYAWTAGSYQNIPNVLRFNCNEEILLADYNADGAAFIGNPGSLQQQNEFILSWSYGIKPDIYRNTLCDANGSGYCLYYDARSTGSVVAKKFNSSDRNFRWILGHPKPTF
jgi:hypothetical protein